MKEVTDLTALPDLSEDKINEELRHRYEKDLIYTYAGTILVALNPYKRINIYERECMRHYHNQRMSSLQPHIYAIADAAYQSLSNDNINQSCVISGESGAGKTESTKFILQYLCAITTDESTWVQQQILEANTILEAFGNAKTVYNDNSSRFGKFMQICFDSKNKIKGCIIKDYLLEKSRITFQSKNERNYKVMYQLVAEGIRNNQLAESLFLSKPQDYKYLNPSGHFEIDIDGECEKFEALTTAFAILQISQNFIDGVLRVLSAILWIGNLEFLDVDGERCELLTNDAAICEKLGTLLQLDYSEITRVMLLRQINVRGNVTEIPLKIQEATENRHAMAKALYSRTFTWLVKKINCCTNPGQDQSRFLGVLDIFGFENFSRNSFEQFCINYANEKLHKFFNHYVFALEQEIYKIEEIMFSHISFTDNTSCLELIEKPPRCIMKLLTEQCHMPKGSDAAYLTNLHTEFANTPHYVKGHDRRDWETKFGIKHYAGCVSYSVDGFVDKNRDVQQDVFFDLMRRSQHVFIQELACQQDVIPIRGSAKGKTTVGENFRHELQVLVDVLQNTKPWYIRCIKPNVEKSPNYYDKNVVVNQLKYLGMLDLIRIRKEGYAIHLPIMEFVGKYNCLMKTHREELRLKLKEGLVALGLSCNDWQIGKTKIFLKRYAYEMLEERRVKLVNLSALVIQKNWKCFVKRKYYLSVRNATLSLQHAYRGWKLRIAFIRQRRSAVVIQSHLRGFFAREVASALREMRRVEDEMKRREQIALETARHKEQENSTESEESTTKDSVDDSEEQVNPVEKVEAVDNNLVSKNGGALSIDLDNLFSFLTEPVQPKENSMTCTDDSSVQPEEKESEDTLSKVDNSNLASPIETGLLSETAIDSPLPSTQECTSAANEPIYESPINFPKSEENDVLIKDTQNIPVAKKKDVIEDTSRFNNRDVRRKIRIERKLREINQSDEVFKDIQAVETNYDMLEFAENYFNCHERQSEVTVISTLTKKNKKSCEYLTKDEMLSYLKSDKIPTSHIHMHDPESVHLACNIFKELGRYMRGDVQQERELQIIQYIISIGIERDDLRDEIFIQCMRQTTSNPNPEWVDRLWILMCLAIVAFQPTKNLFRYYVSYLRRQIDNLDGKLKQYAQWCFDNCKCTKISGRIYPPSSVEVAAMRRLGTIVCRFFFLDGRTKAIDIHPTDTAADAVGKLANKLGLLSTDGWAIYQSGHDKEEHIKNYEYLYDIIAAWESKQPKLDSSEANPKNTVNASRAMENRFVFKKRIYGPPGELTQDPVEINMLYAQAVYSVVKNDEFPISEKVALQLAGLQAQVALGEPSFPQKPDFYADIDSFLPLRISKAREKQLWIPIIAKAHREYGSTRNELTAKVLYLSCVMQYPLYGTTKFAVSYKGFWKYESQLLLGINYEGIVFIQPEEKRIFLQFAYNDIESIMLDPSDNFITITIQRYVIDQFHSVKHSVKDLTVLPDVQRCYVFETNEKTEIGSLIASYFPPLSNWLINTNENLKQMKGIKSEDRTRLYQNLLQCRRQLIDGDLLKKPQGNSSFLKNTLRRFSKRRLQIGRGQPKLRVDYSNEIYKGFPYAFWAYTRINIPQTLSKLSDQDEHQMISVFQAILTYAGLGTAGDRVKSAEDEHITIIQSIMERCMAKDIYVNELYLQLIKQTTDHPDVNSRVNLRHWALLSLACNVILPTCKLIRKYLAAHLKWCGSDCISEESKYARFAEKCFMKTIESKRRQWPPSRQEILCTLNRRPCYARFHFMDGQYFSIEFDANTTAAEIIWVIIKKIGLRETADGYAVYEVLGSFERSLSPDEKLTDVMSKWERYMYTSRRNMQNYVSTVSSIRHNQTFRFKKHLFSDNCINLDDPIEKELLYHQVLYSLRSERFPISEMEAVMLTALQTQLEFGDYVDTNIDYKFFASQCLPPRFIPNIPCDVIAMHHQSLKGMSPLEAKRSFLNLIQSWPLHRSTIFDVTQTFTSNWPKNLWIAVDQNGIHLLQYRSRNVLCSHDYEAIISYSPNLNSLMILTGSEKKLSKLVLNTSQAFQIASLIKDYLERHSTSR